MSVPFEQSEQSAWNRYLPSGIFLMLVAALGAIVLNIKMANMSEASAKVVQSLVWPSFAIALVLFFRVQAESLLRAFVSKVESAQKVSALGFAIDCGARLIEEAKSGPVSLTNVALMHTSFIRLDKTKEFNDGMDCYQIEVIVRARGVTLDRIDSVTYHLHPNYKKQSRDIYVISDRPSQFKLKELANGASIVTAEIKFKDLPDPLHLNRFIDLRPEGPRI